MRRPLTLHPDCDGSAVLQIEAEVAAPAPGRLEFKFVLTGAIGELRLPPPAAPKRADGLWRRTCFEAFIRAGPGKAYCEFNFSPSREWAAYVFAGYREGMRALDGIGPPRVEMRADAERLQFGVTLDLEPMTGLRGDATLRLGLCAVIEETGGRKTYWALKHPPGKPDFHHADCFAAELA